MGVGNVGVNLGGTDIGVTEEGLNRAEIGAVHEEISSKAVTQSVRSDMFGDAGRAGVFFNNTFNATRGNTAKIATNI